ncbi:MAG: hypothetical protein DME22_02720, partial [Verrucomicrobia bacterium]
MTKEARITNYQRPNTAETVDSVEEAFWRRAETSEACVLWQQANELQLIFASIWRKRLCEQAQPQPDFYVDFVLWHSFG